MQRPLSLLILVTLLFSTASQPPAAHAVAPSCNPSSTSNVIAYTSSIDGAALEYLEYLPVGYNPALAYPVAIMLHGSGANLCQYDFADWHSAADQHGYILATIHARQLAGYPGNRMTFYLNGPLAPGEQDVLDAIPVIASRHLINANRLYLAGYSMGGIGTMNIVAQNPGIFAAAAPGTMISDFFQQWDYNPNAPAPNFATLLGGMYGQTAATDTTWYQNSPRFLLANLMHTPLRITHGISDTLIPNSSANPATWPYMQSRHVVDTPGYSDSRGVAQTLDGLHAAWPNAYSEEHLWPAADHGTASLSWRAEDVLTFFDAHQRDPNPLTVAFSTYEDEHTRAYWLQLQLTHPYTAQPGLVYATREPAVNTLHLQVSGALTLTLQMRQMGLTSTMPLTVTIEPTRAGATGDLALVLAGSWSTAPVAYTVTRDGIPVPPTDYTFVAARFTLLRQAIDIMHTYRISVLEPPPGNTMVYLPAVLR